MAKLKPMIWVASTKSDLISLPEHVQDEIGHALFQAQKGEKSGKTKPFKGFRNAAVLEIVENDTSSTYRAVYTVKYKEAIADYMYFKRNQSGVLPHQAGYCHTKTRCRSNQKPI